MKPALRCRWMVLLALALVTTAWAEETPGPWEFAVVRSFGHRGQAAVTPTGPLLRASDGAFYGVASAGVYRLEADGSGFRLLWSTPPAGAEDQQLVGTLWEGPDGRLFGATRAGNGPSAGVLTFHRDGSGVQLLHRFTDSNQTWTVGQQLVVTADGSVVGQAWRRGAQPRDLIFRLTAGGELLELHDLPPGPLDQFPPTQRGLAAGANGMLYGTVPNGGATGEGLVFRIQPDGSGYSVLHEFGTSDPSMGKPAGPLRLASDGNLYGLAAGGVLLTNSGAVYRVTPAGEVAAVHYLPRSPDQPLPEGGLTEGSDGWLYGTAQEDAFGIFSKIYRVQKDGSAFQVIYTSKAVSAGIAWLTEGADGRFYTTSFRGPTDREFGGDGSIFRIEGDGNGFTNVFVFHRTGGDGERPFGSILVGSDGVLYGTTSNGGLEDGGTIYRLGRDGSGGQLLRSFVPRETNGLTPLAGLMEGQDRALYGVASFGGRNNRGTVFRIEKNGTGFAVLHHFGAGGDGGIPMARLTQASDGILYGTTSQGGTNGSHGTVFRLNTNGTGYHVLHDFQPSSKSVSPAAPLLIGQDGDLYGVTGLGGPSNPGSVFALRVDGTAFRVLHTFTTNAGTAQFPSGAGLVENEDGWLFGTTAGGTGFGAIYRIHRSGSGYTLLHQFAGAAEGQLPASGLTRAPDGSFLGLAQAPQTAGTEYASGLLYRLHSHGSNFTVLARFEAGPGYFLPGQLAVGPDAALYAAEQYGGALGAGQIFRLMPPDYRPRFVEGAAKRFPSGEFTAQITGTLGQSALFESSPDFQQWEVVSPLQFAGRALTVSNAPAASVQFYRVRVP